MVKVDCIYFDERENLCTHNLAMRSFKPDSRFCDTSEFCLYVKPHDHNYRCTNCHDMGFVSGICSDGSYTTELCECVTGVKNDC